MMDEKTISVLAHKGQKPESASPHEWLLWYRLRDIYRDVESGVKSVAQGKEEKQTAVNSFHSEREAFERNVLLWKRIEPAAVAFAKNPSIDTANDFYEAVYRMRPAQHDRKE